MNYYYTLVVLCFFSYCLRNVIRTPIYIRNQRLELERNPFSVKAWLQLSRPSPPLASRLTGLRRNLSVNVELGVDQHSMFGEEALEFRQAALRSFSSGLHEKVSLFHTLFPSTLRRLINIHFLPFFFSFLFFFFGCLHHSWDCRSISSHPSPPLTPPPPISVPWSRKI